MEKFDVILTWPRNVDYPLFRQFIKENRDRFGKVIIAFHETNNGYDFRNFISDAMINDRIIFLIPDPDPRDDWRNQSVNLCLNFSDSKWVWFTEQDFFIDDPGKFWGYVDIIVDKFCIGGMKVVKRVHPGCLFVKREVLDKTGKNFSVIPGRGDHFSKFQEDIEDMKIPFFEIPADIYHHMAGYSSNFYLFSTGAKPNFYPDEFYKCLKQSLSAKVVQSPVYIRMLTDAGIDRK